MFEEMEVTHCSQVAKHFDPLHFREQVAMGHFKENDPNAVHVHLLTI